MKKSPVRKINVGIVGMPFVGVPPANEISSISNCIHRIMAPLADDYSFVVVAGKAGRDERKQLEGVEYHAVESCMDRAPVRAWSAVQEKMRGLNRHAMDREVYTPFFARKAAAILQQANCEIIFLYQFAQWVPLFRRRFPRAKIIVWFYSTHNIAEAGYVRKQLMAADGAVACSDFVAHQLVGYVPSLKGKIRVVHGGYEPDVFFPSGRRTGPKPFLFYTGRLVPYKGVHLLVDAFRKLAANYPDLELRLAGSIKPPVSTTWIRRSLNSCLSPFTTRPGLDTVRAAAGSIVNPEHRADVCRLDLCDYRAELLRRAGEAGSRIKFLGVLSHEQLADQYRGCRVFVHPAVWQEAFGLGVLEAMACGAPVVTTPCGGPAETIGLTGGGTVTQRSDADQLAQAIDAYLSSDAAAQQAGERGALNARRLFTWENAARKLAKFIDENCASDKRV